MRHTLSATPASTELAPVSSYRLPDTDVPSDFQVMMNMAKELAEADQFLPDALAGKPGNVLALMLRARALNIPFAVACDELYLSRKGSIQQSARLVRALARRAGHRFFTLESDRHHCVQLIQLAGEKKPHRVEFTMQDAHRMGLTDPNGNNKGGQWDRMPQNMLYARCTTRGVTWYCPEVILGMGSDFLNEEMPDVEDGAAVEADDVVNAYREEDRKLVQEVLTAAEETDHLDDGAEREEILIKLGINHGHVLNYAADEDSELRVRDVLLDRLRTAKARKEAQARGEKVPPAKPWPTDPPQPGGGGEPAAKAQNPSEGAARARKAAGGTMGARARAAEEKAARTDSGEGTGLLDKITERILAEPGTWDRKRTRALFKELGHGDVTGSRAAVTLKEVHQRRPDRVKHVAGTRYTIEVHPSPGQEGKDPTPVEQAAPREGALPCGCDCDQVVFAGSHGEDCTDGGTR